MKASILEQKSRKQAFQKKQEDNQLGLLKARLAC
jgi:hypothetical protein